MGSVLTTLAAALLVSAVVTSGLTAGLLFAFFHAVMPGLATLDDRAFLTAFQRIDAAIANPWLMVTFVGAPLLSVAATVLTAVVAPAGLVWLLPATALVVATMIITRVVHLPLNAALQRAAPALDPAAELRARFERRWVRWNVARTATAILGFGLLLGGLAALV